MTPKYQHDREKTTYSKLQQKDVTVKLSAPGSPVFLLVSLIAIFGSSVSFSQDKGVSDEDFLESLRKNEEALRRIFDNSVFGNKEEGLKRNKKFAIEKIKECFVNQSKSLDLKGFELGTIPSQIGYLTHLEELDLSYNKLTELCPEIGNLKNLKKLNLDGNSLEGLPTEFANLDSLLELNLGTEKSIEQLGFNRFTPWRGNSRLKRLPIEICKLKSLKKLTLQLARFKTLPDEIGQLKSLEHLDLGWSQVTTLPPGIGGLTNLESIQLSFGTETLPPEIGKLKRLKEISFAGNLIHFPDTLGELRSLPSQIGDLRNLEQLDVSSTRLTELPPSIGKLKKLKRIDASRCKLTKIPNEISGLKSIEDLDFSDNQISQIPFSIAELKTLKGINLGNNPLGGFPPAIERMSHLEHLILPSCGIKSFPKSLTEFSDLKVLDLGVVSSNFRNSLSEPNDIESLPKEISKLENLEFLWLDGNPIGKSALPVLSLLTLRWLELEDTNIPTDQAMKFRRQMDVKWEDRHRRLLFSRKKPGISILDFGSENEPSKKAREIYAGGNFLDGTLVDSYVSFASGKPVRKSRAVLFNRLHQIPDLGIFRDLRRRWGVDLLTNSDLHPVIGYQVYMHEISPLVIAFNRYLPVNKNGNTYISRDNTTGKNFVSIDPANAFEDATKIAVIESRIGTKYLAPNFAYHFQKPRFDSNLNFANIPKGPSVITYVGLGMNPISKIRFYLDYEDWDDWGPDHARHLTRLKTEDSKSPTLFDFFAPQGMSAEDLLTRAEKTERARINQAQERNWVKPKVLETPYGHSYYKGAFAEIYEQRSNVELGELVAIVRRKVKDGDKWRSSYFTRNVSRLPRAADTTWQELQRMDQFVVSFGKSFPLGIDEAADEKKQWEDSFAIYTDAKTHVNSMSLGTDEAEGKESIIVRMRKDRPSKSYFFGPYAYVFGKVEIVDVWSGAGRRITLHGTNDPMQYNPIERITITLSKSSGDTILSAINLTRSNTQNPDFPPLMHFFSDRNPKDKK